MNLNKKKFTSPTLSFISLEVQVPISASANASLEGEIPWDIGMKRDDEWIISDFDSLGNWNHKEPDFGAFD